MKNLLTIALILLVFNINAQTQEDSPEPKKDETKISYQKYDLVTLNENAKTLDTSDLIAVKTPKSDTLFLINNEVGRTIEDAWKTDKLYKGKRPVMIFVSTEQLTEKFRYYSSLASKK